MRLHSRHGIPLLIICALSAAPSCSNTTQRHQATVASTGLYSAIAAIDDTERALYTSGALTKAQHDTFAPDILVLLKAGRAANDVVMITGAVPTSVQDTVTALAKVSKQVTDLLPDGPTKSKLQTAIIGAQTAATLLLAFRTSPTGAIHAREPEFYFALGPGRPTARADRIDRVRPFTRGDAGEGHRCGHGAAREAA